MRRIGRWLLNALTALSLLLCVGTCVMWVRGFAGVDQIIQTGDTSRWILNIGGGRFALQVQESGLFQRVAHGVERSRSTGQREVDLYLWWNRGIASPARGGHGIAGVNWNTFPIPASSESAPSVTHVFVGPVWPFPILFSLVSAASIAAFLRRRRRIQLEERGLCPSCRYDLTGNASGVCPECGTKIAEAK